ncbi:MAG TPA: amidophosphoribosyltransferase [Gemmatimonadales bacterium]|jgi:amidophosphoribosyltransferase|nr:amidophosphoribosyltransferase [Gemmatimonadales bacterium]
MCGVFGVSGVRDATRLTYLGLYALQHRGQESAGIVAVDQAGEARLHRGMGLVSDNFDEATFRELPGAVAIGHTRYSTAGSSVIENAQPYLANTRFGPLSVAHNGNLTNALELRRELVRAGAIFSSTSDTEVLIHLIARSEAPDAETAVREALEVVDGASTLLITVGKTIYATVDARGFRPMVLGQLGDGVVVASESCALDLVGANSIREVRPGEFLRIEDGVVTDLAPLKPRPESRCVFELVYFARPDSSVFRRSVDAVRRELGRQLAIEHPAPGADVVFSVPDSANAMALGYSAQSGVTLENGLIRNHYVGRTFINPTQALRVAKVKIKFNPVRDVIAGRSVVVVDDSLVRGTTSQGLVAMIRAAGAREVHLRLGSPPITGPCHYGIDTPTREELIAATHSTEEIRKFLGVDSLGYLSLEGMLKAAGPGNRWCHACFSGEYPTGEGALVSLGGVARR